MYTSSVIARAKVALQGSETEQRIAVLLYDDTVQVISSFELNQLASLSYHESTILTSTRNDMVEILLDHMEQITSQPINYSIISVQKALAVTKHLLLHGAQKVVPAIQQQLMKHVDTLRQYNTVLAAAQQQSTTAWLMRIKGGGVDTAGPVRQIADQIYTMLCHPQQLLFERNTNADPNSLVPIGDRQQIAFITDEVRYAQLKLRIQQENAIQMKSNLKKANDGFGGGYMSTNGKNVVGAAHGIEEMLKQKQKEEQRFSDESMKKKKNHDDGSSYSEYMAPTADNMYSTTTSSTSSEQFQQQQQQQQQQQLNHYQEPDLLSMEDYSGTISQHQPAVTTAMADLLDLGGSMTATTSNHDPFHLTTTTTTMTPQHQQNQPISVNLLYHSTTSTVNPLPQPISTNTNTAPSGLYDSYNHMPSMGSASAPSQSIAPQPSMMNSNHTADRFSALDALGGGGVSASNNFGNNSLSLNSNNNNRPTTTASRNAFSDLVGPFSTTPATIVPASVPISAVPLSLHSHHQQPNQFSVTNPMSNEYGFATAPVPEQSIYMAPTSLSSIQVSQPPSFGMLDRSEHSDSSGGGGGFVMGGSTGTGLTPTGHAPAGAPPPPPPTKSFY